MLGDPELIVSSRSRSSTATQVGDLHKHALHWGRVRRDSQLRRRSGCVPSEFGGLVAATLVGAVVSELLEMALRAHDCGCSWRLHERDRANVRANAAGRRSRLRANRGATGIHVRPRVAVDACALPRARDGRATPLRPVPGAASTCRRPIEANETLERANLQFAAALIATLDARDRYTAGHSAAVAIYSRDIAQRMGLTVEIRDQAYLCGLVHDIGKIGLPPGLLEKPGALTLEERRQMQEHSAIGERILAHVDEYSEIATIVRHHHERIDGQGYPDGLVRRRHSARLANHRGRRRVQRDDVGSTVPRRDAESGCTAEASAGRRQPVRHCSVAAFEAILASADEEYRLAQRERLQRVRAEQLSESESGPIRSIADVA